MNVQLKPFFDNLLSSSCTISEKKNSLARCIRNSDCKLDGARIDELFMNIQSTLNSGMRLSHGDVQIKGQIRKIIYRRLGCKKPQKVSKKYIWHPKTPEKFIRSIVKKYEWKTLPETELANLVARIKASERFYHNAGIKKNNPCRLCDIRQLIAISCSTENLLATINQAFSELGFIVELTQKEVLNLERQLIDLEFPSPGEGLEKINNMNNASVELLNAMKVRHIKNHLLHSDKPREYMEEGTYLKIPS